MEVFDDLCLKCSRAEGLTFSGEVDADAGTLSALKASINTLIDQVLDSAYFLDVWKSVILGSRDDGVKVSSSMYRLLTGYRVIANYKMCIGEPVEIGSDGSEDKTQRDKYLELALQAFVQAVLSEKEAFDAGSFLDAFPAEGFTALLKLLCRMSNDNNDRCAQSFVSLLSEKWLLEFMKRLLRVGKRHNPAFPSLYAGFLPLLRKILQQYFTVTANSIDEGSDSLSMRTEALVDELLLLSAAAADKFTAESIVQAVPVDGGHLLSAMHAVASLWAEKSFVKKNHTFVQSYLTAVLLVGLERLYEAQDGESDNTGGVNKKVKAGYLYSHGPRGVSLIVSLSQGVGAYLDSADQMARLNGMRVARLFSGHTGHSLHFPELDEADKKEVDKERRKISDNKGKGKGKGKVNEKGKKGQAVRIGFLLKDNDKDKVDSTPDTEQGEKKEENVLNESYHHNAGYEFEAYDLGEEPSLDDPDAYRSREQAGGPLGLGVANGKTNYLRACLDMLKTDHTQPEAYEKQRIALVNLPRIAGTLPPDGHILSPALVQELVRLSNHFNDPDFEENKEKALMSLLTTFPRQAVPAATTCIGSSAYTFGARIYATKVLSNAAMKLAALDKDKKKDKSGQSKVQEDPYSPSNLHKTVIKRPLKLARSKRKAVLTVNEFGAVASSFFVFPLLQVVSQLLDPAGTRQLEQERSNEEGTFRLPQQEKKVLLSSSSGTSSSLLVTPLDAPIVVNKNESKHIFKIGKVHDQNEEESSVEHMLVADLLWTLGTCVRCSYNTMSFRSNLEAVTLVATSSLVRNHSSLLVRRASLVCVYICLDSWGLQRKEALLHHKNKPGLGLSSDSNRRAGALETLQNLVGTTVAQNEGLDNQVAASIHSPFQMDAVLGLPLTEYVDWSLDALQDEPDDVSRGLRAEVARAAVRLDDELVEQLGDSW